MTLNEKKQIDNIKDLALDYGTIKISEGAYLHAEVNENFKEGEEIFIFSFSYEEEGPRIYSEKRLNDFLKEEV